MLPGAVGGETRRNNPHLSQVSRGDYALKQGGMMTSLNRPSWHRVADAQSARWLVEQIADESGKKPWLVVSTAAGESVPRFSLEDIYQEIGGAAEIALVIDGVASRALSDLLIDYEDVYGGAARVYPAGYTPENPLKPRPVRLVHRGQSPHRETERLISDALTLAYLQGAFETTLERGAVSMAVIKRIVSDQRAIVDVAGQFASLAQETTYPGVPIGWIFREGQEIEGVHDRVDGRFLVQSAEPTESELLNWFPFDSITLAFVIHVTRQTARLRIHPAHSVEVSRAEVSPNPNDRVDLLLAVGEVVPVRVYRNSQGRMRLRMDNIDDEERLIESLNFGAGPWLVEGRELTGDPTDEHEPTTATGPIDLPPIEIVSPDSNDATTRDGPRPGPGVVHVAQPGAPDVVTSKGSGKPALESMENQLHTTKALLQVAERRLKSLGGDKAEVLFNQVRDERNQVITELNRLREELRDAKEDLTELRKTIRKKRVAPSSQSPFDRLSRFATREEWFAEEIRRTWIAVYTAQERIRWPLRTESWTVGQKFLETLLDLSDSQFRRLSKLVVHLVTGRNAEEQIIESHPLRQGDEVSQPPITRDDGAVCMRAYVEEGVPQSRRLHYWKLPNSSLELSRVVIHDDMDP